MEIKKTNITLQVKMRKAEYLDSFRIWISRSHCAEGELEFRRRHFVNSQGLFIQSQRITP